MSPVDQAGRLPGRISPWVHMRNFSPVSEMRNGQRSRRRVLAPPEFGKKKQTWRNTKMLTLTPIKAWATLKTSCITAVKWMLMKGKYSRQRKTMPSGPPEITACFHPGNRAVHMAKFPARKSATSGSVTFA